jgi:hypothetical protein
MFVSWTWGVFAAARADVLLPVSVWSEGRIG